jgi:hypothetical protein
MDMRCGTWNVRRPFRSELLKTVVQEVLNYRLGSEGVHGDKWDNGGTEPTEDYFFSTIRGTTAII